MNMRDELAGRQAAAAAMRLDALAEQRIREVVREEIDLALARSPVLQALTPIARIGKSDKQIGEEAAERRRAAWQRQVPDAGASSEASLAARSDARSTSSMKSSAHSSDREDNSDVTQVDGSASSSARSTFSGVTSQSSSTRASATTSACICRSSLVWSRAPVLGLISVFSKFKALIFRESARGGKA